MEYKTRSPRARKGGEDDARPKMKGERRAQLLEALGLAIAAKRESAIAGRLASGIESIWTEDDEHYQGYDAANRHEFVSSRSKPTEGGSSTDPDKRKDGAKGSTLFPPLTGRYCDAAAAKVADMLLPTDDRNFVIEPTPVPDVLDEEEGWPEIETEAPEQEEAEGLMAQGPGQPPQMPGAAAMMQPQPATTAAAIMADPAQAARTPEEQQQADEDALARFFDKIKAIKAEAEAAAKAEQDKIDDWLTECSYHTELRKMIDDCARIGTGVMKGPIPEKREMRARARNPQTGEWEIVRKVKTAPVSRRVSAWDCFPDYPACGEDIQRGSFFLEREYFSGKMLRALKGGKGAAAYIDENIDKVLKEGPSKRNKATAGNGFEQMGSDKDVFEVWRFYGTVSGEDLMATGCDCDDPDEMMDVVVTVVNDTVIKGSENPLESGEFPFDMMPWQARPGMPWGTGVARQGRTAQRITTAALRNLLDNAGASSRPHKVITGDIEQAENPWTWRPTSDAALGDVRQAMMFFVQPSLQPELMNIISLGERRMEMDTGLPMIILGLQGNVQETAHGRALQNNNGATVLRRIARYFDAMTERHIRRYHEWVLEYENDDGGKRDFQIKARGSAALVERDLQNQQMPAILQASLNPAYGLDPELAMEEFLKSQKFSPKAFQMTDKRKKELAAMQPPPPPQIVVAEMREKGATERKQMDHAHDERMAQFKQQFDGAQHQADREMQQMIVGIEERLRMADISSEERQHLETQKVALAKVTLQLNTQRELSGQMTASPQVAMPAVEPPQRAPTGQAFVQ